jgi:hypothetical protein
MCADKAVEIELCLQIEDRSILQVNLTRYPDVAWSLLKQEIARTSEVKNRTMYLRDANSHGMDNLRFLVPYEPPR